MTPAPNPGTQAAIDAGCLCPVMDNCNGRGYHGQAGVFVYVCTCPVHVLRPAPEPEPAPEPRIIHKQPPYKPPPSAFGFTGDICPQCGGSSMARNGSCLLCQDCGSTTGCS